MKRGRVADLTAFKYAMFIKKVKKLNSKTSVLGIDISANRLYCMIDKVFENFTENDLRRFGFSKAVDSTPYLFFNWSKIWTDSYFSAQLQSFRRL